MMSIDNRSDWKVKVVGLKGMFVLAALGLAVATDIGLAVSDASDLFVSTIPGDSVLEYNGTTGAFATTFVPPPAPRGSGGLLNPQGLTFGPNGDLFVSDGQISVQEYNGTTGAFVRTFATGGPGGGVVGGLSLPEGLTFGPN